MNKNTIYIVDMSRNKYRIVEKYDSYEESVKHPKSAKEEERVPFWINLILYNLELFDRDNLFAFIPDLKLSEICDMMHNNTKEKP